MARITSQSRERLSTLQAQLATFTSPLHIRASHHYFTVIVNGVTIQRSALNFWIRHGLVALIDEDTYEVCDA